MADSGFSEGGFFPATLTFPPEYPNKPPEMKFLTQGFWHPNGKVNFVLSSVRDVYWILSAVYPDGKVCISILHEHKEDAFNEQEKMCEKWRPILGVSRLGSLLSIV